MLDWLYEIIGRALAFFYSVVPNLGVAIILLTIVVMLLLFPLTAKQAKSMLEMQRLQPEMKKLQAKHKGDRQKLNEEMMKLYQEHQVNPLGGCLPLLAQLPVFIALFRVLREAYKWVPVDSDLFSAFCPGVDTVRACNAATDLPRGLTFLGLDLSLKPLDDHGSLADALPYFLLVGLVVLTGLLQSWQTQRNQPAGTSNPQMQIIGKVLPVVFGFFTLQFPAGLGLYWFVSSVWRLGQQEVIFRRIHLPHRERIDREKGSGAKAKERARPDGAETKPTGPAADGQAEAEAPPPSPRVGRGSAAGAGSPAPGRGLRGLFRLPPPVEDGTAATGAGPDPEKPAVREKPPAREAPPAGEKPAPREAPPARATAGTGSRSGQARRRRTNKKKRKR